MGKNYWKIFLLLDNKGHSKKESMWVFERSKKKRPEGH